MAALSCGMEALMFGSLMMLASGLSVRAPSSASAVADPLLRLQEVREIRDDAAREGDVPSSTAIPACLVKARTIGRRE